MSSTGVEETFGSSNENKCLVLRNDSHYSESSDSLDVDVSIQENKKLKKELSMEDLEKNHTSQKLDNNNEVLDETLHRLLSQSEIYADFVHKYLKKHEHSGSSVSNGPRSPSSQRKRKRSGDSLNTEENTDEEAKQPSLLEGAILRNYQLEGFYWLKRLYECGLNGILADEMGLGKTIQAVAFLCHLMEEKVKGPFLVVAPLSTITTWEDNFSNFAPKVKVLRFHGPLDQRNMLSSSFTTYKLPDGTPVYPVVLTTYEMPLRDRSFFKSYNWKYVIVDEGHRLKNVHCQLGRSLRSMSCENRLILTGTPLQNNLEELWALLNFLMPTIFKDLEAFENWCSHEMVPDSHALIKQEEKFNIVSRIHKILAPFLLRRMKADIDFKLPPKKEVLVYSPMSDVQIKMYSSILNGTIEEYLGLQTIVSTPPGSSEKRKCTLRRKVYLYDSDEEDYEENEKDNNDNISKKPPVVDEKGNECKVYLTMTVPQIQLLKVINHPYLARMPLKKGSKEILINEDLIQSSGKFLILDALLPALKSRGHKVLLFSTLKILLDLVEEYLIFRKFQYYRLDGSTKLCDRSYMIKSFNEDPDIFLFVISTRAGGLGINLTGADTAIILNSDWNPQVDLQAQDRCHRIGQIKPVVVYRIITKGTIDEKVLEYATKKRNLEKVILHKSKFKSFRDVEKMVPLEELKALLETKNYDKVVHTTKSVLTEEQLNELLDRSDMQCTS